ncbi:hypothetical protein ET495_03325 [Xylanimonas allomyrinae]|uniref:Alpha-glucuronidase n=1 Tax=Xylanimonas allomyrinae TaxID=2509459 RepID=A0A4P6EJ25_9MICO|nr:glycosyl hydrolase 115 family protein [Xylanimonas allomyrinae]QAY62444.1 hypothetical protein ET495_03325 [Xylanimonas allomyrinae]
MQTIPASRVTLVVEPEAHEGVRRVAATVARDFATVTGVTPAVSATLPDDGTTAVVIATLGRSPLTDAYAARGEFDPAAIAGKDEVFQITGVDGPALLVVGADKRATIYGAFALSEHLGVSPLHYWGDATPQRRPDATLGPEVEQVSRQPSVRYRGFFINDEWPCFGTWTHRTFGGFTAELYDHVFELLLRLRGNYLWPAMWTSSFAVDGPGQAAEELADLYGIVVGASHHEPCLRASEEWEHDAGEGTAYGSAWDFTTNAEGLTRYWADGLRRSGGHGRMITIGMRGERDSAILGDDSPIQANVDLLTQVITTQRALCAAHAPGEPQMLALYKEVEDYFYGSADVAGLADWDGLDDVILMLCDDNFGFVRSLPTPELAGRRFGLYYHFDYHGQPVSYEWMPSTPFEKTWEQLSKAYEFGIRDTWVVNVGDLKFNEVSLAHFMALAYDMDTYGAHHLDSVTRWADTWTAATFPTADAPTRERITAVLRSYVRLNGLRRPEAIDATVYHPAHHGEADRLLAETARIQDLSDQALAALPEAAREAYRSMIDLPASASLNLLRMHLFAAKNHHFAAQGKKIANDYAAHVTDCIENDRRLTGEIAALAGGKWHGMELAEHVGFTQWNDSGNRYPLRMQVEPVRGPRMVVSRPDGAATWHQQYGRTPSVVVDDFLDAGVDEVTIEIANDGTGALDFTVEAPDRPDWLTVTPTSGTVTGQGEITLRCDRPRLGPGVHTARLLVSDGATTVALDVAAAYPEGADLPPTTFLARRGVVAIDAHHAASATATPDARFVALTDHGRSGTGVTVRPVTASFTEADLRPSVTYRFVPPAAGECTVELWTTPVNPVRAHTPLRLTLETGGHRSVVTTVPAGYTAFHTDPVWETGVLDNIRVTTTTIPTTEDVTELTLAPLEPGLILERILVYPWGAARRVVPRAAGELAQRRAGRRDTRLGRRRDGRVGSVQASGGRYPPAGSDETADRDAPPLHTAGRLAVAGR